MGDEMVIYRSAQREPSGKAQIKKKNEKTRKEFLTNDFGCAKLNRLTARAAGADCTL